MDEHIWTETEIKERINQLIWVLGHPALTLLEAEKLAITIFELITRVNSSFSDRDALDTSTLRENLKKIGKED